jgi:hypothetical protein
MSHRIRCLHRTYYLPSMAGIATAIYEDVDAVVDPAAVERSRADAARQLAGVENLAGTYPFDFVRSVKAYRLNDFLHRMVEPAHRERFRADPEASFEAAGLTEERDLVRRLDCTYDPCGVIFFMRKSWAVASTHLRVRCARRSRRSGACNAPGALYRSRALMRSRSLGSKAGAAYVPPPRCSGTAGLAGGGAAARAAADGRRTVRPIVCPPGGSTTSGRIAQKRSSARPAFRRQNGQRGGSIGATRWRCGAGRLTLLMGHIGTLAVNLAAQAAAYDR